MLTQNLLGREDYFRIIIQRAKQVKAFISFFHPFIKRNI